MNIGDNVRAVTWMMNDDEKEINAGTVGTVAFIRVINERIGIGPDRREVTVVDVVVGGVEFASGAEDWEVV